MTKEKILNKKIGFISLGCDKNRVDLEKIISSITDAGFQITNDENEANIIIVNTCAFLEESRKEALNEILNVAELKQHNLEKIIITGCLTRYKKVYKDELSNVDLVLPIKDNKNIVSEIFNLYGVEVKCKYNEIGRVLTTPPHIAYLKIAEGCNNRCAYCAIPMIRGNYKSVEMETLLKEAKMLVQKGVKELVLVAQDVTSYGIDLYGKRNLIDLLKQLEEIEGICWIRLLYCYPEYITDELIEYITQSQKVLKYIDVPMQHISNDILLSMHRKNSEEMTYELIRKLQKNNITIRSTFMVGFPGESKQDFAKLVKFLKTYKLDKVGFFAYSNEMGTLAYEMQNQIETSIKNSRLKKVQKIQNKIYMKKQKQKKNNTEAVIIDEILENRVAIGRTINDCYQVDSEVYFALNREHKEGDIVRVLITGNIKTDLKGEEI